MNKTKEADGAPSFRSRGRVSGNGAPPGQDMRRRRLPKGWVALVCPDHVFVVWAGVPAQSSPFFCPGCRIPTLAAGAGAHAYRGPDRGERLGPFGVGVYLPKAFWRSGPAFQYWAIRGVVGLIGRGPGSVDQVRMSAITALFSAWMVVGLWHVCPPFFVFGPGFPIRTAGRSRPGPAEFQTIGQWWPRCPRHGIGRRWSRSARRWPSSRGGQNSRRPGPRSGLA